MLQLQDVKVGMWCQPWQSDWELMLLFISGLAEAALGEGAGTKLNKMSVKEIKFVRHGPHVLLTYMT